MRALTALGRSNARLNRHSVEALALLCDTVREDELDERCAAQRASVPQTQGHFKASVSALWRLCMHDIVSRRRHAFGAMGMLYGCVRGKPAVPWAPEAASRACSAMVAAVRPLCIRAASIRQHAGRC